MKIIVSLQAPVAATFMPCTFLHFQAIHYEYTVVQNHALSNQTYVNNIHIYQWIHWLSFKRGKACLYFQKPPI